MSTSATSALAGRSVAVVGGGIAGLTAALALSQRGAAITVHERAPALREAGAGIQLSPNAVRALDALGLAGPLRAAALPCARVILRDAAARQVAVLDLARHRPGAPFLMLARPALMGLLEAAARASGVTIRTDSPVNTPPEADVVVGADGLHSAMRRALNGREVPFFTGQTAWRAVIPDNDQTPEAQVFMGCGRHLVSYPLPGGLRNIVAVLETREWSDEGWSITGDPEEMRAAFAAFTGPVPGWLSAVQDCGRWGLFRHVVAKRWQDGRIVLIGDAAHTTLPFLAQGAAMAVEDALRLTLRLEAAPPPEALAGFEAERRPRVARIVEAANANARNYHLTGARRTLGHAALRMASAVAGGALVNRFGWVYDYDPTVPNPGH